MVSDLGVLDGIGRVGVAELPLNRGDIAGFLDEVPAHGVAGVMGRMALDTGQAADLVEHRVDHPGVETTVAVGVGGCRYKQRRSVVVTNRENPQAMMLPSKYKMLAKKRHKIAKAIREAESQGLYDAVEHQAGQVDLT